MAWTYEITSGKLFRPDNTVAGVGYAGGQCGARPETVNNPQFFSAKGVGPLPPGDYIMGWGYTHPRLGPNAIPLFPKPSNVMYGRGDFFMHADLINAATKPRSASDGCIVQGPATRSEVDASTDRMLTVVASLSTTTGG